MVSLLNSQNSFICDSFPQDFKTKHKNDIFFISFEEIAAADF